MNWLLVITGVFTGFLVGLTGIGGGALMTPILMLLFGIAPRVAVGTDLWFASITKLAAARIALARGLIDWDIAIRLWIGSLPASLLTLLWLHYVASDATKDLSFIKQLIAAAIIWAGLGIVFQPLLQILTIHANGGGAQDTRGARGWLLTVGAGALIGALVTLTSVGAGAIGTAVLMYLYPMRLTPPRLVATEITHAIPLAIFGGLGHLGLGNVDLSILVPLLIGSVPAAVAGAMLASRLSHSILRSIISGTLLTFGAKLWWIPK